MNTTTPYFSRGLYSIKYANGTVHRKHLIAQEVHDTFFLESHNAIALLKKQKPETKEQQDANNVEIARLREWQKTNFGDEFFTTESPLGKAMATGKLDLSEHQGGIQQVTITKL